MSNNVVPRSGIGSALTPATQIMRRGNLGGCLALACAILAASASGVTAADHSVLGRTLLVRSKGAEPTRLVKVVAKEPATDVAAISDPTTSGATLKVYATGGSPAEQDFELPAGGWSAVSGGFRYRAPVGAAAPVSLVLIKRTPSGVALIRAKLSGSVGTLSLDVVPPNAGDTGGIELGVTGGDRYCVGFGGAAGGTEKADSASLWKVVRPTSEAACLPAPTPTPTPGPTPTPPPDPVCGNGVIEGTEECDGAAEPMCGSPTVCGASSDPLHPCSCCFPDGTTYSDFEGTSFGDRCCESFGFPINPVEFYCGDCLPDGYPALSGCGNCCSGVCGGSPVPVCLAP
jgi:hypothetical protein